MIQVDAPTAAILGAAVGAGISGLTTIGVHWFTKRSEERRRIWELAVNAAIASREQQTRAAEITKQPEIVMPLEIEVLHFLSFARAFLHKPFDEASIAKRLDEVKRLRAAANKYVLDDSG